VNATGTITMAMREVDRSKVIQAAERRGLCVRQVERLVRRLRGGRRGGTGVGQAWPLDLHQFQRIMKSYRT
jgi:hypothetical protein